jgi:hypothetical protein
MSGEGEPETLAEEDPEAQLAAFSVAVNKADTSEEVMEVAMIFAEDGVNIWQVWREHPERARELVGVDVEPTDGLVEKFDRIADE